ncbi:MAG: LysM peptidoglycan-binding domain-containing protein, partial [Bacteroidota bacterium]
MKSFSLLVAALLLTTASVSAEQIFVLFDGTCGDRVLYEQAIATQPRMDYYAYHFPLAGGDRLILETGAEGVTVQNYLPQGYIYCGDPRLSLELADRANNEEDRVFVLLPTQNNQYLIQPVVMGAVFQRQGAQFSYFSPLTGYQFDTENGIIGENLAYDNPGAKVYFEGRDNSPCSGYFLFRQLNPKSSYPVIDFKIAPEIGIYERRLGSDGKTTSGGVISVRTVNGVPIDSHLANVCAGATTASNGARPQAPSPVAGPATYGSQPVLPQPAAVTSTYPQPESAAAYAATTPAPATQQTHTVAKGETLYRISKQYGTTVDAIKAQNGLTSNTVFAGQQLTVVSNQPAVPTASPAPVPNAVALNQPPTTTVPTLPYNPGAVANSNPGAAQPTPYGGGTVAAPQAYGETPKEGGAAVYGEDLHTVQPGETVASIALKHGFTSAKFREINGLGPNEFVKVGARLKTTDCNCPAPPAAA